MTKYVNAILRTHLAEKVEDKPVTTESTTPEIKSNFMFNKVNLEDTILENNQVGSF